MRSLIILEVEHDDSTDEFVALAAYVADPPTDHKVTIMDYTVRVDVPPFMHAVNINAIIDRGLGLHN